MNIFENKIEVRNDVVEKWSRLLNSIAQIVHVPSALVMRVEDECIQVFASNDDPASPYKVGDSEKLRGELYCEYVIDHQKTLHVPNALTDPEWDANPDIKLGMISYLGFPINWPNGVTFGTVCILDSDENQFSAAVRELMFNIAGVIQQDLEMVFNEHQLAYQNNMLEQFTRTIAHDLKSPMATMITSTELLKDPSSIEEIKEIAELLSNSCERLYQLVGGLHAFFSGKSASFTDVDLNVLLKEIRNDLQEKIDESGAVFELDELPKVLGVHAMLYSIFLNVIGNAIKFRKPELPLMVGISSSVIDDKPGWSLIKISDNGIGIDPREASFLFESSYRSKKVKNISGTGVGLYTCRLFVQYLGGRIWAEGELGVGTTICIALKNQL